MIKLNGIEPKFDEPKTESDNETRQLLKMMLKASGLSLSKAVKAMNEEHPEIKSSTQNISNKLSRDSINFAEFIALASACGFNVNFTTDDYIAPEPNKTEKQSDKSFDNLLSEGMADYHSKHFGLVVIAGLESGTAARFITDNIEPDTSKMDELRLMLYCNHRFNVECKPTYEKPYENI